MTSLTKQGSEDEEVTGIRVEQVWRWHVTEFRPPANQPWTPAINIYRLPNRLEVCIELAGMDPAEIDLRVEAGHLTVSGSRRPPQPELKAGETMQILGMEIDHGPFGRSIAIPTSVDLTAVQTRYSQGVLRVVLPLR